LFSKQTADITTVKVNLIKLSIAGRGGFVKEDYVIARRVLVFPDEAIPFMVEIASGKVQERPRNDIRKIDNSGQLL